ncbi:sporulation cortex protein CoxA [Heyndrickxia sporothermodurans]|nr:sporulation cortex protein CoxA [Heyndrickxia sporothermodurans]
MNRKILFTPIPLLIVSTLAACNYDQNSYKNQTTNNAQQVGYHTNNRHIIDHDGPMTELIDYSFGNVDNIKNNNYLLPSGSPDDYDHPIKSPLTEYNTNNKVVNKNRIIRDINYHGHLNHHNAKGKSSYYTAYEGGLAEKLSNEAIKVKNVTDARALIDGNNVIISIVLNKDQNVNKTKQAVERVIRPYISNRQYIITTDQGTYYRARQLDNDLKNGNPRDSIKLDLHNMFKTLNKQRNQPK